MKVLGVNFFLKHSVVTHVIPVAVSTCDVRKDLHNGGSRPGPGVLGPLTFCPALPPIFPLTTYYCPLTRRLGPSPQSVLARTAAGPPLKFTPTLQKKIVLYMWLCISIRQESAHVEKVY